MAKVEEFPLNMDAEVAAHKAGNKPQVDAETSTEIAARIGELMRAQGVDDEANPLAAEKIQRDLLWQRQVETLPQPDGLERPQESSPPEFDRLEQLQKELESARAETAKWKKEFGRREGKVGGMEARIRELEARVSQVPVPVDVRAMTGRDPSETVTAQDIVNLMMAQSQAFGKTIQQVKEELLSSQVSSKDDGLPLDLEAELVEAHPWLTDLPRPQKMRAMHDILASSGVTVTPQAPNAPAAPQTANLPEAARAQVRQAAFIEPSNKGSMAERNAVAPERQAYNERVSKLKEALNKPGGSDEAAKILAALGAGPVDETQIGYTQRRR